MKEIQQLKAIPRRPYQDDEPDGYLESDRDYLGNNRETAIWLLEHLDEMKSLEATLRRREHEVVRKDRRIQTLDKRIQALEQALAESPVPPGKYAYVANKRRQQTLKVLRDLFDSYQALEDCGDCGYLGLKESPEGRAAMKELGIEEPNHG